MPKIDFEKYPKIIQMHSSAGCIPVNIENALKYYGEKNYDELNEIVVFLSNKKHTFRF